MMLRESARGDHATVKNKLRTVVFAFKACENDFYFFWIWIKPQYQLMTKKERDLKKRIFGLCKISYSVIRWNY